MQHINSNNKLARRRKGFTLAEMMIAITLGMVLINTLLNVVLGSVQTYSTQTALSEIQDDGRLVLDIMASHIRMAGYQETTLGGGRLTDGIAGTEGTGTAADTIVVRTQSGLLTQISAPLVDCAGNYYPGAVGSVSEGVTTMTNTFTVTANQLRCTNGLGTTVTLANNVEDLQLLYGVDTTSDGEANQYVNASSATMTDAVSVSICLIVRSTDNAVSVVPNYIDCTGTSVTATDFRIRKTLNIIVNLRNAT